MSDTPLGPGDRVPAFTLLPFGGGRPVVWRPGRVTVLSFCALWCDTWRAQSARLAAVRRDLAGLPVAFHTVSVDGRWAERFANGAATDSGVLLDEGGRLSASLGVRAVPWTLAVDRAGVIRLARQGIVRAEELEATLRRLVTSAGDAPGGDAAVYLTFDDFPAVPPGAAVSPDEELLDILRAAGVPTTFFCIGEHLTERAGAAAARRAAREGHSLQMHAWSHDAARPDLRRCVRIIADVTGRAPTLYRPPGSTDLLCADGVTRAAGAARSSGTLAPYDHMRPGRAELTRRVLFGARTGTVIQLHAGVPDTRDALPGLLDTLRRRGLTFATLG